MLCGRAMDGLTTRVFRRPRKCSSRAEAHILVMWPRFAAQLALMRAVMHRERGGARREGRGEGGEFIVLATRAILLGTLP